MKLNNKRTLLVGLAFFAICAFWQLYDHVVPLILKYTFGVKDSMAGGVMAADNLLALFMLPLFGALSDRTKTPWGRRKPFIVVGSIAASVSMLFIPISSARVSLPLFIVGLGLTLFFMATYRSSAVALMPDVTIKPLRSKANAIINLMGAVGGIIILGLLPNLLEKIDPTQMEYRPDYLPIFLSCAGIMVFSTVIIVFFVKEPQWAGQMAEESKLLKTDSLEETKENIADSKMPADMKRSMIFLLASVALWFMGYNAITTSFSKYCVERFGLDAGSSAVILMVANGAAILSYIPVGIIATKVGRKACIIAGVLLLTVAFGAGSFFHTFSPVIFILFMMAGVAWAAINVNSYPMVVEMARGENVGKYTGYYYTASMSAQIATPILSGIALEKLGYASLFPYGAIFVGLSFITILMVHHGDAKPIPPKSRLEAFEGMDD